MRTKLFHLVVSVFFSCNIRWKGSALNLHRFTSFYGVNIYVLLTTLTITTGTTIQDVMQYYMHKIWHIQLGRSINLSFFHWHHFIILLFLITYLYIYDLHVIRYWQACILFFILFLYKRLKIRKEEMLPGATWNPSRFQASTVCAVLVHAQRGKQWGFIELLE